MKRKSICFLFVCALFSISILVFGSEESNIQSRTYLSEFSDGTQICQFNNDIQFDIPINWEKLYGPKETIGYRSKKDHSNNFYLAEIPDISSNYLVLTTNQLLYYYTKDLPEDNYTYYKDPITFNTDFYIGVTAILDIQLDNGDLATLLRSYIIMKYPHKCYSIDLYIYENAVYDSSYDYLSVLSSIRPISAEVSKTKQDEIRETFAKQLGFKGLNSEGVSPSLYESNTEIVHETCSVANFGTLKNGVTHYIASDGKYGIAYSDGTLLAAKYDYIGDFVNDMARVHVNGKFGLIDTRGNYIIEPFWDYLSDYSEVDRLIAFTGTQKVYGDIISPDEGTYYIINSDNEIIREVICDSMPNRFLHGVSKIIVNGKTGYLDINGEYIIKPEWDDIDTFFDGVEYVSAEKENHRYVIDMSGEVIFDYNPKYHITYYGDNLNPYRNVSVDYTLDGFFQYGYVDNNGKIVIKQQWQYAREFSDGLAAVLSNDNKWGFINTNGTIAIPLQWDNAESFVDGFAKVELNDLYGYIDTKGNTVIPCVFTKLTNMENGVAIGCKNNKWYLEFSNGFEEEIKNVVYEGQKPDPIVGEWYINRIRLNNVTVDCDDDTYATMIFDKLGFFSNTVYNEGEQTTVSGYYKIDEDSENEDIRTYVLSTTMNGDSVGMVFLYADDTFTAMLNVGSDVVYYSSEEKK